MPHKATTFDQTASIFSRPGGNTTGRFVITKHELGYRPYEIFSLHQITVKMTNANARWGVSVSAPGSDDIQEHTTPPVASGAGAKEADTVTISEILADVIQIDMVGMDADASCSVHIVSRPRGFGN